MRRDLREGFLDIDDRRLFEVTTGHRAASGTKGRATAAADRCRPRALPGIRQGPGLSRRPAPVHGPLHPRRRCCGADPRRTPPNRGLDVRRFARRSMWTTTSRSRLVSSRFRGGTSFQRRSRRPSAELTLDEKWPWLSLHTCLRAAIAGIGIRLKGLLALIGAKRTCWTSAVAPWWPTPRMIAWWNPLREDSGTVKIRVHEHAVLGTARPAACCATFHWCSMRIVDTSNTLVSLAARPVESAVCVSACVPWAVQTDGIQGILRADREMYSPLRRKLGREDVPISAASCSKRPSGSTRDHRPAVRADLTADLRQRFEASTGINCTDWGSEFFDRQKAAQCAAVSRQSSLDELQARPTVLLWTTDKAVNLNHRKDGLGSAEAIRR